MKVKSKSNGWRVGLRAAFAAPLDGQHDDALFGERRIYYLLDAMDPEFSRLFKVAVDFEDDMERGPDSDLLYARMIATLGRNEKLRALDRAA